MDSTPYDLEPYLEAFKMRQRVIDQNAWQHNMYTLSAVQVAVERCLSGKKARSQYLEEPMSEIAIEKQKEDDKNISEDEIVRQRKALLAKLQIMQTNFELNHSDNKKGKQD